jgi:hypothetical protein
MKNNILLEVNNLKAQLKPRAYYDNPGFYLELANILKKSNYLSKEKIVQNFIEDMQEFSFSQRLIRTKTHINSKIDHHIFSLFDASYFPTLSLDFLSYTPLDIEHDLVARYPSGATPVTIDAMSEGFKSRIVVALFPENHIDHIQGSEDLIFYFIDKFIERHNRITKKLLNHIVFPSAFALLRTACDKDIEKASARWVHLHEYFHRQGPMPIPEYLHIKSIKPLAGLEELRVDISGALACLSDRSLSLYDADLTYQFILSERILRYAVEGIPKPNYDAIASQMLFNYLLEDNAIYLKNGIIHISKKLPNTLAKFLAEINSIESLTSHKSTEELQEILLAFVNQYTLYDEVNRCYRHIDFFEDVKKRLEV